MQFPPAGSILSEERANVALFVLVSTGVVFVYTRLARRIRRFWLRTLLALPFPSLACGLFLLVCSTGDPAAAGRIGFAFLGAVILFLWGFPILLPLVAATVIAFGVFERMITRHGEASGEAPSAVDSTEENPE